MFLYITCSAILVRGTHHFGIYEGDRWGDREGIDRGDRGMRGEMGDSWGTSRGTGGQWDEGGQVRRTGGGQVGETSGWDWWGEDAHNMHWLLENVQ